MSFWVAFTVALAFWLFASLVIGAVVGRMFGNGWESVYEDERQWPERDERAA